MHSWGWAGQEDDKDGSNEQPRQEHQIQDGGEERTNTGAKVEEVESLERRALWPARLFPMSSRGGRWLLDRRGNLFFDLWWVWKRSGKILWRVWAERLHQGWWAPVQPAGGQPFHTRLPTAVTVRNIDFELSLWGTIQQQTQTIFGSTFTPYLAI